MFLLKTNNLYIDAINEDKHAQLEMLLFLSLLIVCVPLGGDTTPISCYNDQGEAVDWFYMYKLPKDEHIKSPTEGEMYLLLERGSKGWTEGKTTVNDTLGALGQTVGQLYSQGKNSEIAYILYNDQSPTEEFKNMWDKSGSSRGHTKGVVLLDKNQGFWLVHSTPHFPPERQAGQFYYPSSGVNNGQNFICVTYPLDRFQTIVKNRGLRLGGADFHPDRFTLSCPSLQFEQNHIILKNQGCNPDVPKPDTLLPRWSLEILYMNTTNRIGEQLQINQPKVYDCDVPESLTSLVPALAAVCEKKHLSSPIFPHVKTISNRSVTLTSKDGTDFISFAKGASFDNDLYHSWVAPALQSDLLVQFWVRSTGILPSDCSLGWKVLDITLINPGQTFTFKATQDHSKWAVSPTAAGQGSGGGWVCVGDINRNEAEEKRGGGTVCLQDPVVWKAYRTAALQCEACGGETIEC